MESGANIPPQPGYPPQAATANVPPQASRRSAAGDGESDGSRLAKTLALGLTALSLFWLAAEQHQQSCVEKVQAQFPAITVSALTGRQTGPLKVSYVDQRTKALEGCGRFF